MAGFTLRGGPVVTESGTAGWTARGGAVVQETAGGGGITGTLAKTLDNATLAGVGALAASGTLSATLADVTLSASGNLAIFGATNATLDNATLSSSGQLALTGTLNTALADATLAGVGASVPIGTLNATLDDVTCSSVGTVPILGTLAKTLDDVTLTSAGAIAITGTLNATLANVTLTASGSGPSSSSGAPFLQGIRILNLDTAADIMVMMVDSADHITALTGLTLTCELSKDCGFFASISPTVTEIDYGWYKVSLTASDIDTIGDLILHVTATGADPSDVMCRVGAVHSDIRYVRGTIVDGSGTEADPWGP